MIHYNRNQQSDEYEIYQTNLELNNILITMLVQTFQFIFILYHCLHDNSDSQ